jgi:DNA-directed RNA polymerase specialized sigma24 family protein
MAFPTTRWSILAGATLHGDSRATAALGEFYNRYRGPVRTFFQLRGVSRDDLDDLVQAFFLHAMEKSLLRRADRGKGTFRSWLCGAAVHFLSHHRERMEALKRGGGLEEVSLDSEEQAVVVVSVDDVREFDRAWAVRMLELAMERVQAEFAREPARFALLREFLPGSARQPGTAEAAQRAGLKEATLRSEVFRLRLRFRECLRAEVALTTNAPHEVEGEIAWLREVLSGVA